MVDVGKFVLFVAGTSVKKRVEDVNPVATGHEREELEAELEVIFLFIILFWVRKFCFQKFGLVAQKNEYIGEEVLNLCCLYLIFLFVLNKML